MISLWQSFKVLSIVTINYSQKCCPRVVLSFVYLLLRYIQIKGQKLTVLSKIILGNYPLIFGKIFYLFRQATKFLISTGTQWHGVFMKCEFIIFSTSRIFSQGISFGLIKKQNLPEFATSPFLSKPGQNIGNGWYTYYI